MAFVKDPGRRSDVNKVRESSARTNLSECKIYVCKLWEKKLVELTLERYVNAEFFSFQEKAMIYNFRKKRLLTAHEMN